MGCARGWWGPGCRCGGWRPGPSCCTRCSTPAVAAGFGGRASPRRTTRGAAGRTRDEAEWTQSPFYRLAYGTEPELRRRLGPGYRRGEFPLLDRFRDEGSTDYVAFAARYGGGSHFGEVRGVLCSFQTDRPGGFDETEVALLRGLAPALGLAFKSITAVETAGTLVATYLGADAGRRVLDGAIPAG